MNAAINHVWQSTLFVALAWLVVITLLRNTRAQAKYAAWLTASVKFLIPFATLVDLGKQLGWMKPVATPRMQASLYSALDKVGRLATIQIAHFVRRPVTGGAMGSPSVAPADRVGVRVRRSQHPVVAFLEAHT